ncbi:MAG: tetratricopeptide repeat protein [Planctomycetota bacterium]
MSASQDRAAGRRLLLAGACVLVLAITFLAFLPVLSAGWLNWDDDITFLDNPHWRGLSPQNLRWMLSTPFFGHYRPVSWLSFALEYPLWKLEPRPYHLTSLLIHCACALLLFLLARRLLSLVSPSSSPSALTRAASFAALLFSIHPLRVEPVAWLTARGDLLCAAFLFASALAYLGADRSRFPLAAFLLFGLSLLSKAASVAFPFVLVLLDLYPLRRLPGNPREWFSTSHRRILLEKLPFLVLSCLLLGLAVLAKGRYLQPIGQSTLSRRLANVAYSLSFYPLKTLLPLSLLPLYQLPRNLVAFLPRALGFGAFAVALTVALLLVRRRAAWGIISWLIYLLLLAPVSGILQSGPQLVADRYSYLATVPFALLAGAALLRLFSHPSPSLRRFVFAAAITILALLFPLTYAYSRVWKSSFSLWTYAARLDPSSTVAHLNLGSVYEERGDIEGALRHYERVLAVNPGSPEAHLNIGRLAEDAGDTAGAEEHYRRALAANPHYAKAHLALGNLFERRGNLEAAISAYQKAIEADPLYATAYNNLGNGLRRKGDLEEAIRAYRKAIAIKDDYANAYYNLANAVAAHDPAAAERAYARSVELDPGNVNAWFNLGNVRAVLGDLAGAIAAYEEVLRHNPDDVEARRRVEILKGQTRGSR